MSFAASKASFGEREAGKKIIIKKKTDFFISKKKMRNIKI